MVKKKVCLLGCFGVGKTSLVRRFVESMFTDKYHTTVGVKIDKKVVSDSGQEVTLMLWDVAGEEDGAPIQLSYVSGASGYLLVADGTRSRTLDVARSIRERVESEMGPLPSILLINKSDLRDAWEIPGTVVADLRNSGWTVLETSALSGDQVEEAFLNLSRRMLADRGDGSESEDDD